MPSCKKDNRAYFSGKEPSPKGLGLCAHAEDVGTVAVGQDGATWEIRADKRGIKSWKKVSGMTAASKPRATKKPRLVAKSVTIVATTHKKASKKSTSRKKASLKKPQTTKSRKQTAPTSKTSRRSISPTILHEVVFCEPYSYIGGSGIGETTLLVSDVLYRAILAGPTHAEGNDEGNGYIFGPRFPLREYERAGEHGNDVASTGFIDTKLYKPLTKKQDAISQTLLQADNYRYSKFYSDAMQKLSPGHMWTGETVGGDVGAVLYAHRNAKTKELDGLIVDNSYYFPDA